MYHCFKNKKGGFSLIEMLVSLGIMVVILTVVVLNQRAYTQQASLINHVDDLSLTITQAQSYGLAVRERAVGTSDFDSGYGVSFSTEGTNGGAFIFFADRNNNGRYDSSWTCPTDAASECLKKTFFTGGNQIYSLCRIREILTTQCVMSKIDITFKRPSPVASYTVYNSAGNPMGVDPEFIGVRIGMRYQVGGTTRFVTVYDTGQISVQ